MSALPGLFCPACGQQSLAFPLLESSPVTCYNVNCSRRTAATEILADRQIHHVVTFTGTSFTIRHPLIERLDDALVTCDLNRVCRDLPGPLGMGRYVAKQRAVEGETDDGWYFEEIAEPVAGAES